MSKKSLIYRLVFSLLALFFLYRGINFSEIIAIAQKSKVEYLILCFLMICANYTISGFRWRSLIFFSNNFKGRGVLKLNKLYFVGAFFNNFMPTSIGGDVYKAYILGKNTADLPKAIASTLLNRLSGVFVLFLFSTISLTILLGFWGILVFALFWITALGGLIMLFLISKLFPEFKKYSDAIFIYKNHKKEVLFSLGFSVLVQIVANLAQYFSVLATGSFVSLPQAFFAFPLIGFVSFLPISFNGFGLQDFMYKTFLGYWGIPVAFSLASSALFHFIRLLTSLIGGVFLIFSNDFKKNKT